VVQGGVNAGAVTIVFKEYGIRLTFLPSITERGTIHMHVKPEVSTIDLTNAVEYNGFTIPALETRRVETDIELGAGQSFAVAGLIDDRVTANFSKIPGLAQIPILGTLFKSRQDQKSKTELIVMVTPEITAPVNRADTQPLKPMPEKFLAPYLINPGGDAGKAFDPPKPSRPK